MASLDDTSLTRQKYKHTLHLRVASGVTGCLVTDATTSVLVGRRGGREGGGQGKADAHDEGSFKR